jgi:hypothetical protein
MKREQALKVMLGIGLTIALVSGCSAFAPTPTPVPTPTSTLTPTPTPTPTPAAGIRVPAKGTRWQVTLTGVQKTTKWQQYTNQTGFVFLLIDVTCINLDATQKTVFDTGEATVTDEDGKILSSSGFLIETSSNVDSINGKDWKWENSITNFACACQTMPCCRMMLGAKGNTLSLTQVFIVDEGASSKTLRFQFQDVPPIPFSVK